MHDLVLEADLFPVIQVCQFDYTQTCLAYCCNFTIVWVKEDGVAVFLYRRAGVELLGVPAHQEALAKRSAAVVQIEHLVCIVPVKCNPEPTNTLQNFTMRFVELLILRRFSRL